MQHVKLPKKLKAGLLFEALAYVTPVRIVGKAEPSTQLVDDHMAKADNSGQELA
jgi:hypothetical protein